MGANLTQAAEKVLGEIYAAYLDRRSEGFSKNSAMDFSDQTNWPDPDWRTEDGEEALNELSHAKLIQKDILGGLFTWKIGSKTGFLVSWNGLERLGRQSRLFRDFVCIILN